MGHAARPNSEPSRRGPLVGLVSNQNIERTLIRTTIHLREYGCAAVAPSPAGTSSRTANTLPSCHCAPRDTRPGCHPKVHGPATRDGASATSCCVHNLSPVRPTRREISCPRLEEMLAGSRRVGAGEAESRPAGNESVLRR
jgi:hypothetical protein